MFMLGEALTVPEATDPTLRAPVTVAVPLTPKLPVDVTPGATIEPVKVWPAIAARDVSLG